jgi:TolA-binding protein
VSEEKMERMIGEMQQFKGVIEELSGDRDAALQQVKEMQSALREREEKIESLNELLDRLEGERQENEYLQSNYDELKK